MRPKLYKTHELWSSLTLTCYCAEFCRYTVRQTDSIPVEPPQKIYLRVRLFKITQCHAELARIARLPLTLSEFLLVIHSNHSAISTKPCTHLALLLTAIKLLKLFLLIKENLLPLLIPSPVVAGLLLLKFILGVTIASSLSVNNSGVAIGCAGDVRCTRAQRGQRCGGGGKICQTLFFSVTKTPNQPRTVIVSMDTNCTQIRNVSLAWIHSLWQLVFCFPPVSFWRWTVRSSRITSKVWHWYFASFP